MYLKADKQRKILERARDIQQIAKLETCGIPELTDLYSNNYQVQLWFKTWIENQAAAIEKLMTEE